MPLSTMILRVIVIMWWTKSVIALQITVKHTMRFINISEKIAQGKVLQAIRIG